MNQNVMSTFLAASSFNRKLVDTALARLFRVQFRLGLFDPLELNPFGRLGPEVVDTPAHRRLAREAADQSLVLLKNNAKVLPLRSGNMKAVAVVGRNANATNNMQGNYFGTAPFLVSPLKGIAKHTHTKYADGNSLSTATQLAATADAVVLVVGLTSEAVHSPDEAEGHDRTSLTLPDNQDHYIAAVAKAAKAADSTKPVVLVIMGGGPVDVAQWRDSADVDAIIWVGYPGQSGGDAIADVLFGVTVPSGKLTQTWYPQSFADKVSILDMGMRPNKATGNPGRSYRFYTGDPVFKFGEGLSYTEFIHAGIVASRGVIAGTTGSQQVVHVTVDVQNSGDRDATEIVLVFAAPPDAGEAGAPLQQLVAFERVFIRTAQTKRVSFRIPEGKFSYAKKGASETVLGAKNWTLWTGVKEASTAVVKLQ
jgi:hypothetical protein